MLTKIVLKNFKSFKNTTTIDVTATNYKMLNNSNIYDGILKGLLFVGANASGKTNAITSILFLFQFLFAYEEINFQDYFCFYPSSGDMLLEYSFIIKNEEIKYGFSLNQKGLIQKEYLFLNGDKVLDRIGNNAESKLTDKMFYDEHDIDKKTLFIRNIYFNTKFKGFPSLATWFQSLSDSVYVNAVKQMTQVFNNSNSDLLIHNFLENQGVKKINDFFSYFGFNQKICYENEHSISNTCFAKVQKEKEIFLKRNNIDIWIPFSNESLGNKTLLNMLPAILHAIEKECILIIDEFSSAFHNELEELIIRYFLQNSMYSQIFFVSHSTNLLSTTLLRPDQIYSTNFDDANGTYLKRFSSEGPRESQNLEKMYLNGIFDGLPRYKNTIN